MYQHDPRHVDVLVKDLGLEQGNSVQWPVTHDVTHDVREGEPVLLDQVQQSKYRSQVASCLLGSSGQNIHCERVMSKDVKPHATERCQVEEACQKLET